MSYESEQMESLRYAIRQEIPAAVRELRNFQGEFGNGILINALNANTNQLRINSLLQLCEISMQRPELNLLSSSETVEILKTVKENIVEKTPVIIEHKSKKFLR